MTTYDELAQRYIDTWNETDPSARRAAVDQLFTEDARYVDPLAVGRRPRGDRVDDRRGAAAVPRLQLPVGRSGRRAPQPGPVRLGTRSRRGHRHRSSGFDVAVSDDSGRIQTVLGFLDKVPAPAVS